MNKKENNDIKELILDIVKALAVLPVLYIITVLTILLLG